MNSTILRSVKYFVFAIIVLAVSGCKETVEQPEPEEFAFEYPVSDGVYAGYDVDSIDAGGIYYNAGRHESHLAGQTVLYGTPYIYQYDTLFTGDGYSSAISYIRKSGNGVYYFIDTSGIGNLIPDSLRIFVVTDPEMTFYSFPFEAGRNWSVYKFIIGNFTVISISAEYKGRESLTLNINNTDVTLNTYKIDYRLSINIPDSTLSFLNSEFRSTSWLADGYGIVKTRGSKVFISLFSGAVFDISDTAGTLEQRMTAFRKN